MPWRNLDPRKWLEHLYRTRKASIGFTPEAAADLPAWQAKVRQALVDAMGGWPEPVPLEPEITDTVDDGSYMRHRVVFNSEAMMSVSCYLLVPKDIKPGERRPAILALHGHGKDAKDNVCGVKVSDEQYERLRRVNYDYGRQFAERGYVVIAPDHRNFGERQYTSHRANDCRDTCNLLLLGCMLFNRSPLLANVFDARRCIDYLEEQEFVDPDRIGAVGLSYGGTMTLWTAALDERIKAACVSCYINTFEAYAIGLDNTCGVQTPQGLLTMVDEMWEIAALIAPRTLVIESGIHDPGFPIEAARSQHEKIRWVYELVGAADKLHIDVFDGAHEFHGEITFPVFAKALNWKA